MTTESRLQELESLRAAALAELDAAPDADVVEAWRVAYLGRSGKLTQALRSLSDMPIDDRKAVGAAANRIKQALEEGMEARRSALQSAVVGGLAADQIDITLPGRPVDLGRYHPNTIILRKILDIFVSMGFQVVEGPEVEWDRYNFNMLNIPQDHPARDMFDTFWVDWRDDKGDMPMLMRTHTSPMQARIMEQTEPPIRVVVPGKVFRYEATDATHESQFFQIEGLAVDKNVTFANLKHTLYEFARRMFGDTRKVRFRCDYFPFVEPGVDMSIDCFACDGRGDDDCRICRGAAWIEILGAGMVHPNVLRGVGYDPDVYTGFAFGMGLERIAMLKYGIDDIRLFYGNDLRFLKQF